MEDAERQSRMDHFNAGAAGGEHESSWEAHGRQRIRSLWGKKDIGAVFPEGSSPIAVAPWPDAGKSKHGDPPEQKERVQEELGRHRTVMIDPRILSSTQPAVTHQGLAFYMGEGGEEYDRGGPTFADAHERGNTLPLVETVRNTSPNMPEFTHRLRGGHHRALRAALMGRQFEGRWVEPGEPT